MPTRKPWNSVAEINADSDTKVWFPDFSLKRKLGKDIALESIITPAVSRQAQASIDAVTEDSLGWLKDDIAELKALIRLLLNETNLEAISGIRNEITEVALLISSCSGTFGYCHASQVAYALYLFCRKK